MLTNIHYLGKVKWNERATVRWVEDGVVIKSRPRAEEFLVFEGKHPAIIDQELWDKVQDIMGSHPKVNRSKNQTNPLAGIMWCTCGIAMVGRRYYDKEGRERCAPRFLCGARKKCGNVSARMSDVVDEVKRVLRECIHDFEVRIDDGEDNSIEVHRQLVARLEKKLDDLRALEKKQWDEKIRGKMPPHIFDALNQETVAEIEEVHHALCEAKGAIPEPIDLPARVATFKAALETIDDPNAPVKEVNLLLKACIERITYSREPKNDGGIRRRNVDDVPMRMDFALRV
jgi:hypothetical protein